MGTDKSPVGGENLLKVEMLMVSGIVLGLVLAFTKLHVRVVVSLLHTQGTKWRCAGGRWRLLSPGAH